MKTLKNDYLPFENKSLEKNDLFLDDTIKTIGYQHSSISNRHFSLILNSKESKIVPLPNKIITTGYITRDWLISKNIPKHVSVGKSSRNANFQYLEKKIENHNKIKLFFPFSSSYNEIYDTIHFLKKFMT